MTHFFKPLLAVATLCATAITTPTATLADECETQSGEVEFQHLTLRFGTRGEQSVYQFELSEQMQ